MIRAVLFDFNGTLSDDEPVLCAIWQEIFARLGRPMSEEDYYERLAGRSEPEVAELWLGAGHPALEDVLAERVRLNRAVVVAADDIEHGKPDPEGFLLALARLPGRIEAAEVVALEDTAAGVAAAKAAGVRCVAVLGTMGVDRLAEADEIVERIDVPLMRRLLG